MNVENLNADLREMRRLFLLLVMSEFLLRPPKLASPPSLLLLSDPSLLAATPRFGQDESASIIEQASARGCSCSHISSGHFIKSRIPHLQPDARSMVQPQQPQLLQQREQRTTKAEPSNQHHPHSIQAWPPCRLDRQRHLRAILRLETHPWPKLTSQRRSTKALSRSWQESHSGCSVRERRDSARLTCSFRADAAAVAGGGYRRRISVEQLVTGAHHFPRLHRSSTRSETGRLCRSTT